MRVLRHPDKFCEDSRPYWALFLCFILCNILLLGTLYTRQPERYRRISRWFSTESSSSSEFSEAQASAFTPFEGGRSAPSRSQGVGQAGNRPSRAPVAPRKIVEFGGMTLGDAASNQARKRDPGAARYGVEILRIDKTSVPYLSGMRKSDIIVSVNRMPTYTVDDFKRGAQSIDTSQGILFDVYRNGRFYYMTVETRNAARW